MNNIEITKENQAEYVKNLEETCKTQEAKIKLLENKIAWMMEQMTLSKHKKFGASSEKSEYDQLSLFNDAENEADDSIKEPTMEEIMYKRKKQVGKKKDMLKDLPTETVEYFLPEEEIQCEICGSDRHIMGKNIRLELKIIPPEVKVVEHVTFVYSCRDCENKGDSVSIVKSTAPEPVIKGSIASPSLVAYIMTQKYVNAMPLYRQEQDFKRLGIDVSRQNMANWVIRCASDWLDPLYSLLKETLLRKEVLHADESVLQVLKEPGKKPQSNSYMWLYRTSGDTDESIVLYEYQPDRKHDRAKEFLKDFKGYLMVDGYEAYHNLSKDIIVCGCLSHVRRKFDEALKSIATSEQIGSKALAGKNYCDRLFAEERKLADSTAEERYEKRLKLSKPILEEFLAWLKNCNALPQSALGKAVNYALNQWKYLENYLLDGRCELSNNRAERSIKNFVIGRKNFLFADTVAGARASAIVYSIMETAKENNLNPMKYLTYIFENMPNINFKQNPDLLKNLLPWAKLPAECYITKKD
jgi:transposase